MARRRPLAALALAALFLLLPACPWSPITPRVTLWEATLVGSPGFEIVSGSVAAVADEQWRRTDAGIQISDAPPTSVLPWRIRSGPCGMEAEIVGAPVSYPNLATDETGSDSKEALLSQALQTGATYSVEVWRAPEDERVIACGALLRL